MIKEITFEEIKVVWQRYLWPHMDVERDIPYSYFPTCEYVSRAFQEVNPEKLPSIFIGYYKDERSVGVLNGYKTSHKYFRSRGLWVDEQYRGIGIATEMMRYIEGFARYIGCKYIWTLPRKSAIGFYDNYGFVRETDFIFRNGNNCFATKKITTMDDYFKD